MPTVDGMDCSRSFTDSAYAVADVLPRRSARGSSDRDRQVASLGVVEQLEGPFVRSEQIGEVFGHPFPERLPWRDDDADELSDDAKVATLFDYKLKLDDMWAT